MGLNKAAEATQDLDKFLYVKVIKDKFSYKLRKINSIWLYNGGWP